MGGECYLAVRYFIGEDVKTSVIGLNFRSHVGGKCENYPPRILPPVKLLCIPEEVGGLLCTFTPLKGPEDSTWIPGLADKSGQ